LAPIGEKFRGWISLRFRLNALSCLCSAAAVAAGRGQPGPAVWWRADRQCQARPALEPRLGAGMVAYTASNPPGGAAQALAQGRPTRIWINAVAPSVLDTPAIGRRAGCRPRWWLRRISPK
jgi:hypothetical protein